MQKVPYRNWSVSAVRSLIGISVFLIFPVAQLQAQSIIEVIDASGAGSGMTLDAPVSLAINSVDDLLVAGSSSDNVFRVSTNGQVAEIINADGAGFDPNTITGDRRLLGPVKLAVDNFDNVYVLGAGSNTVITANSQNIISDSWVWPDQEPSDIAADNFGNVFYSFFSTPPVIRDLFTNNSVVNHSAANFFFQFLLGVETDGAGNIYMAGQTPNSNGVTGIARADTIGGAPVLLLDSSGDGQGRAYAASKILAVDTLGNVYAPGNGSFVFEVSPAGSVSILIDENGDNNGNTLIGVGAIATDDNNNVYVAGLQSDNVFKISPAGEITEIIDALGDGIGNTLDGPSALAVDSMGNIFVAGKNSDNVFSIPPGHQTSVSNPPPPALTPLPTIDSNGGQTTAVVSGGISINNQVFSTDTVVGVGDTVFVSFRIQPEFEHIGRQAEILIAVVDRNSGVTTLLGSDGKFYPVDLENLVSFGSQSLAADNAVEVTSAAGLTITSDLVGTNVDVIAGYLVDGIIYYNQDPITLMIE